MRLPPAHRFARINYPNRTGSFAFSFIVLLALLAERGFDTWTLALGIATLLVYPQLAYLHARIAVNSKRAEYRNLTIDSLVMGMWATQIHFALWPVCAAAVGVCMDNAVCGGPRRFLTGLLWFACAAILWGALWGFSYQPQTGIVVTALSFLGIIGYVTTLAVFFYGQNRRLLATRNVLRSSEEQFRFIAEHAGDLVCVLTPEHRFRYSSPSYRNYFDSASVGEGRDWLDLVHPEDRRGALEFLEGLRDAHKSRRAQLRIVPTLGSWRVVECVGNPVHDQAGELQMNVLVCRDLGRWLDAINSDSAQSQRARKSG